MRSKLILSGYCALVVDEFIKPATDLVVFLVTHWQQCFEVLSFDQSSCTVKSYRN